MPRGLVEPAIEVTEGIEAEQHGWSSLVCQQSMQPVGTVAYTQCLNPRGGIESDLTVTRLSEEAYLIVTGAAQVVRDASQWTTFPDRTMTRPITMDDAALAAAYHRAGLPVWCAVGGDAVRMRSYPGGLRQLAAGWTKNIASGASAAAPSASVATVAWISAHHAVAVGALASLATFSTGLGATLVDRRACRPEVVETTQDVVVPPRGEGEHREPRVDDTAGAATPEQPLPQEPRCSPAAARGWTGSGRARTGTAAAPRSVAGRSPPS